jgi:hypothetical protein
MEKVVPSYCLLADRPDFVPALAHWFWREWGPIYEVSPRLRSLGSLGLTGRPHATHSPAWLGLQHSQRSGSSDRPEPLHEPGQDTTYACGVRTRGRCRRAVCHRCASAYFVLPHYSDEHYPSVTLDTEDLPTHRHINSWLVCVYVCERFRGQGIIPVTVPIRALADHATCRACGRTLDAGFGQGARGWPP